VDQLVSGLGTEISYIPVLRVESQDGRLLNYEDHRYYQSFTEFFRAVLKRRFWQLCRLHGENMQSQLSIVYFGCCLTVEILDYL